MTEKTFNTHWNDTELNHRSGQRCEVVRPLDESEADIDEVGPMFRVRFDDGFETDAFIYELE